MISLLSSNILVKNNRILTLINLLLYIRFNVVLNFDIFIDHFEFQKNWTSTTLKCQFWKILSYCSLNLSYATVFLSNEFLITIYGKSLDIEN